jgi:hypothetical protein
MEVYLRCLLATSSLFVSGLLLSGCFISLGEDKPTTQFQFEFQSIDKTSLDLDGHLATIVGTGNNYGSNGLLSISFEFSEDTFACLLLAETARTSKRPLFVTGFSIAHRVALAYDGAVANILAGPMIPGCAYEPEPAPSPSPLPSPDPSPSPEPSPSPAPPPWPCPYRPGVFIISAEHVSECWIGPAGHRPD